MIRSRDLVIFVGILFCLTIGIAFTYVRSSQSTVFEGIKVVFNNEDSTSTTFSAVPSLKKVDRQGNIERLRSLLAMNTEILTEDPSVVETPTDIGEVPVDEPASPDAVALQKCAVVDDGFAYMQKWPVKDNVIVVKDGMRRVVHVTKEVVAPVTVDTASTSSSTVSAVPKISVTALLVMPMYPGRISSPACVDSEIVGVTVSGALLTNSDAQFYRSAPSGELIGYARDGFPVYGPYSGEVDSCGGYMHPEGYRYTIGHKRDFVLGCYVGNPLAFSL